MMTHDTPHRTDCIETPRRRFLKQSATLAAGVAVGFYLPAAGAKTHGAAPAAAVPGEFEPNAWVRVLPDGTIKLVVHKHDSGTGTHTSLAAVVAEELDVDPMRVDVITPEHPFYKAYIHPLWKVFSTGGSTSVSLEYDRLRHAGATARAMLVAAAAQQWGVGTATCTTDDGHVLHAASGRRLTYGALAEAAARQPVPADVPLKNISQFKYIGKLDRKRGALAKATGRFPYSIDLVLPGMWVAVVARAPVIGARVAHVDSRAALAVPGVRQVLVVPGRPDVMGGNQEGVAVLADDYWAAHRGRAALQIQWKDGPLAAFDSDELAARQAAWLDSGAAVVPTIRQGNADAQWKDAAHVIEAAYQMPYKAQNPLEPICIAAHVKEGRITYWGGVQVPSDALEAARLITGIPAERITINDRVSGGSFGARESKYWMFEVTYLAHQTGRPIKLMNSREDEMHSLYYHAATYHRVKGALDARGNLAALHLRAVSPASPEQWEPGYFDRPDHMDYSTTEAIGSRDFAYRAPHMDIGWVRHETGVPTGWYRAVSFIPNVFAVESFIDEMAHAAGRDPLAFRLAHMQDRPRHVAVLRTACEQAGWGKPLPAGTAMGISTNQGYNSYIAVVARVARKGNDVVVEKLTCVVDCGLAVSPAGVEEQVYGGLMWGLGHARLDRIDIRGGRVAQSNFNDYPVTRMADMPEIDILLINGDEAHPGGVGELAGPSVAPALANAIFRLTGQRQRATPLKLTV